MEACNDGARCDRTCGGWHPFDFCPCGDVRCPQSSKLKRNGHVVGCVCRACIGKRNRSRGQRAQANAHKRLGGVGKTPTHEEWGPGYDITVWPEVKQGGQIPAAFGKFIGTEWFRRALSQSERSLPVGSQAHAGVYLQLPGDATGWLIVKVVGE